MADFDWQNLGFGYHEADFNIRTYFRDGAWTTPELTSDTSVTMSIAATCLHYGQECFEGLKAFRGKDGKIRIFRIDENAKRLQTSASYLQMQAPSVEHFINCVDMVVKANERFLPPYGTGASLYIRPVLLGTGAQVGVNPAKEYLMIIFVTPVGPYYKGGVTPIKVIIDRDHDRAAPLGTGHIKAGGNYAASLISGCKAHELGYPSVLYLDAREKKYIDECGAANFFGIKDGKYITPTSHSILPSITNMSLQQIAKDMGLSVESRNIELSELESFEEIGSCGTAAVVSPIYSVFDPSNEKTYTFGQEGVASDTLLKLYNGLRGIQYGELEDVHSWNHIVE